MCYTKKTVICEENIYQLNLVRRFKTQSDLSLYDHKFYLICCQWNTREPDAVCNVRFLIVSSQLFNLPLFLAVTYQLHSRLCSEHSRIAASSSLALHSAVNKCNSPKSMLVF